MTSMSSSAGASLSAWFTMSRTASIVNGLLNQANAFFRIAAATFSAVVATVITTTRASGLKTADPLKQLHPIHTWHEDVRNHEIPLLRRDFRRRPSIPSRALSKVRPVSRSATRSRSCTSGSSSTISIRFSTGIL